MSYTLAAAAAATGLSRKSLLRAIKDGSIAATKDRRGEWRIDPDELHRVYPPVVHDGAPDVDALGAQIEALLRQAGDRLQRQLDAVRREREHVDWREHAVERSGV
jgi:excisionase family DNA binding protein